MVAIGTHHLRLVGQTLLERQVEMTCDRDYHIKLPSGRVCWRNRRFIRPLPTEGGDPKEEMMTSDERHVKAM